MESRTLVVDEMFRALSTNADAAARALADQAMDAVDALEAPPAPELSPLAHDRGRDLTSGRVSTRQAEEPTAAAAK